MLEIRYKVGDSATGGLIMGGAERAVQKRMGQNYGY